MEIMDYSFKSINQLEFPFELPESIETLCNKWSMKKYLNLRYKI